VERSRRRGDGRAAQCGPPARPARDRFSTRRRLIVAFSAVLAAVLFAFALQLAGLRKMEVTFSEMKEHEDQMRLALELEDAVRDQYGEETRVLMRDAPGLEASRRSWRASGASPPASRTS
jgi:hypothetical protein